MNNTMTKFLLATILSLGTMTTLPKEEKKSSTTSTIEEVKALAAKAVNGTILDVREDGDDYDVYVQSEDVIYEVEVEKQTGRIDDIEQKNKFTNQISLDEAKQIALTQVAGTIVSIDYDRDDFEYDIEIIKDGIEYDMEISARDGRVIELEKDD